MTTKKRPVKKPVAAVDPIAVRAQQATDLKYAPELDALKQLGAQAQAAYIDGRDQTRAAANSIVAAAAQSQGGLADFLKRAGQRSAALSEKVAPVAAGISNEGQLAARNHGLDVESVAAALANTKVRAQQAAQFQQQNLYKQYRSDVGKINDQAASLAGQAGQYAQAIYQSLLDDKAKNDLAARKIAQTAKNAALARATQRLLAGVDQNGQVIPGSAKAITLANDTTRAGAAVTSANASAKRAADASKKAAAKAAAGKQPKWLTAQQQNTYVASVKSAAQVIKEQIGKTYPDDIKGADGSVLLKAGQPLTSTVMRQLLRSPKNPTGRQLSPDQVNAAMDVALRGGLSPANVKALHAARVKINGFLPVGVKTPAPKQRTPFDIYFGQ